MGVGDGGLRSAASRKESFVSLALDLSPAYPAAAISAAGRDMLCSNAVPLA